MGQNDPFDGAKVALFLGDRIVSILRDDHPGLAYAGYWDLPGGGREGGETPWACAARECFEELGLVVPESAVCLRRRFQGGAGAQWFFAARLPVRATDRIVFGNEGQRWTLMPAQTFISHPKAIPRLQDRLRGALGVVCSGGGAVTEESPPLP